MNTQPRRAYVSGAISGETGETREAKLRKFEGAQRWLEEQGYAVVNPVHVPACADYSCRTADGKPLVRPKGEDGPIEHSWTCYMRNDIKAMMDCQEIWMIPGFWHSAGAETEKWICKKVQIEVKYFEMSQINRGLWLLGQDKISKEFRG